MGSFSHLHGNNMSCLVGERIPVTTPYETKRDGAVKLNERNGNYPQCESDMYDQGFQDASDLILGWFREKQKAFEECDDHERQMIGYHWKVRADFIETKLREHKA